MTIIAPVESATTPGTSSPSVAFRNQVHRGVTWKAISGICSQLTRLAVAATLAHLLSPHDYGVAGIALVTASLVMVLSDLGISTALVHRTDLTEADRSTVFWTTAGAGALCTAIGMAAAGPVAHFYGEAALEPLFRAMSVGFFITSISSVQSALLTREMNFRALELRQILAAVVGGVAGIALAVAGAGAWAIIAQQLAALAMSTVTLWIASGWRPHFRYSLASLKELVRYGGPVFGSRLTFFLNRNADNLLIGRFLGPSALGAYAVSYNLMLIPLSQISLPLQDVLFPAFSRMQGDTSRMASAWLRANRLVGAITIPGMLGVIAVAPDFVHVVLGPQWSTATPVLQILAWVGLLQSLQGLNGVVLRSLDRTATLFRFSLVALAASLVAFIAGLPFGITGVAAAYAISTTLVEPYYTSRATNALGIRLRDFFFALWGTIQAALLMFTVVLVARAGLVALGTAPLMRLPALIALGILVFVPAAAWRAPELIAELRRIR